MNSPIFPTRRFLVVSSGTGALVSLGLLAVSSRQYPLFFFIFWFVALIAGVAIGLISASGGVIIATRVAWTRRSRALAVACGSVGLIAAALSAGLWAVLSLDSLVPTVLVAGTGLVVGGTGSLICAVIAARSTRTSR